MSVLPVCIVNITKEAVSIQVASSAFTGFIPASVVVDTVVAWLVSIQSNLREIFEYLNAKYKIEILILVAIFLVNMHYFIHIKDVLKRFSIFHTNF